MKFYLFLSFIIFYKLSFSQFDFLGYSLISFPEEKYQCIITTDINKKGYYEVVKNYYSENEKVIYESFPLYQSINSMEIKYDSLSNLIEIKINYKDSTSKFIKHNNFYNNNNFLDSTLVFSSFLKNDTNKIYTSIDSFSIIYEYENDALVKKEYDCIGLKFNSLFSTIPFEVRQLTECNYTYNYCYTENKLSLIYLNDYDEKTHFYYDQKEFNKIYDVMFMPWGNFILLNKNGKPKLVTINQNRNIIEYSLIYSINKKIKLIKQYRNRD